MSYEDEGRVALSRIGLDGRVTQLTNALAGSELDRPYVGGQFSVARDGSIALTTGIGRPAERPGGVAGRQCCAS